MATATERIQPEREPANGPGERRPRGGALDGRVLALTILGFALAAYRLGTKSMWLDEAVSADHARLGLSALWTVITSHDPNMGLYYVLLHLWTRVFGYSEAAVRSMTVVLAGFSVPVMYLLGKRLFGRTAGLVAGLLLAIAPFFVQYEQTARSYALVVLLVLLSSCFFVEELEVPSRTTRIAYVLTSVLAVYAHYFAVFVLLVQALTLIAVKRRGALTATWLSAAGAIVVLCIPAAVFAHRAGTSNISWINAPSLGTLFHLPTDLAGGRLLALVLVVLACYGFVRALAERQGRQAGFVAAWLIVPVILVFAASRLGRPLFVAYYLIIVLPPFLLLPAAGVAKLPRRETSLLAVVALVVLSAIGVRNWYDRPSLEDYRAATHDVLANERPGDGVVYYPAGTLQGPTSGFVYYETRSGVRGPAPLGFAFTTGPQPRPPRIWLVTRQSDTPAQVQRKLQETLGRGYRQAGPSADFRNVTVTLYRRSGA
ncbi:MAG: glycosyltransferase family 39 protein [Solirubrobacteraceae bacterium]